jgi:hypothetical protein
MDKDNNSLGLVPLCEYGVAVSIHYGNHVITHCLNRHNLFRLRLPDSDKPVSARSAFLSINRLAVYFLLRPIATTANDNLNFGRFRTKRL